jgi:FkbM family methyltransferase
MGIKLGKAFGEILVFTGVKYHALTKKVSCILYSPPHTLKELGWMKFAKAGGEIQRYQYDGLDSSSVILDLGGYQGDFAAELFSRYLSKIHVFEPYKPYAKDIATRFKSNPQIETYDYGLSNVDEVQLINIDGESSSIYKNNTAQAEIQLKNIVDALAKIKIENIDLIKINIEGSEYDLLDFIIESDLIQKIDNLQIQFHDFVPNAVERMREIQERLSITHYPTYQYDFIWENWKRK